MSWSATLHWLLRDTGAATSGASTSSSGGLPPLPPAQPHLRRQRSSVAAAESSARILLPPSAVGALWSQTGSPRRRSSSDGSRFDYGGAGGDDDDGSGDGPLTFEVRCSHYGSKVFVGVESFTAEEGTCALTPAVVDALGLDLADAFNIQLNVRRVRLPKATSLVLTPLTAEFSADIADPVAVLQTRLPRLYTCLSREQLITVWYEGKGYPLCVKEIEPASAPAVVVIDTDCSLTLEGVPGQDSGGGSGSSSSGGSSSAAGGPLTIGTSVTATLAPSSTATYRLETLPSGVDLRAAHRLVLSLTTPAPGATRGVDVYILATGGGGRTGPSKASLEAHDWAVHGRPGVATPLRMALTTSSVHAYPGCPSADSLSPALDAASLPVLASSLSILVVPEHAATPAAATAEASFTLSLEIEAMPSAGAVDDGATSTTPLTVAGTPLAAPASSSAPAPTDAAPLPPGTERCPSCGAAVPSASLLMHTARCGRQVKRCDFPGCGAVLQPGAAGAAAHAHCGFPGCGAVMPAAWLPKHAALYHEPGPCPQCGDGPRPLGPRSTHARTECPRRMHTCRFCGSRERAGGPPRDYGDRMRGFSSHESACGARTDRCAKCGVPVRLRDMETHYLLLHPDAPEWRPGGGPTPLDALPGARRDSRSSEGGSGGGGGGVGEAPEVRPTLGPSGWSSSVDSAVSGGGRGSDDGDDAMDGSGAGSVADDKSPYSPAAGGWSCPACTLLNSGAAQRCTLCETPRPAGTGSGFRGGGGGSGGAAAAAPPAAAAGSASHGPSPAAAPAPPPAPAPAPAPAVPSFVALPQRGADAKNRVARAFFG